MAMGEQTVGLIELIGREWGVEVEWSDDELFGNVPVSIAALAPILRHSRLN